MKTEMYMFEETFPKIETDRNEPSLVRMTFEGFFAHLSLER
ncbi:MAG: hypothetical protein ACTS47_02835 [Candidatus Hodgkinia cicadicola]